MGPLDKAESPSKVNQEAGSSDEVPLNANEVARSCSASVAMSMRGAVVSEQSGGIVQEDISSDSDSGSDVEVEGDGEAGDTERVKRRKDAGTSGR